MTDMVNKNNKTPLELREKLEQHNKKKNFLWLWSTFWKIIAYCGFIISVCMFWFIGLFTLVGVSNYMINNVCTQTLETLPCLQLVADANHYFKVASTILVIGFIGLTFSKIKNKTEQ